MVDKFLIRTLHDDLAELVSFFEFFCTDHIIDTAAASDKIFLCDHMSLRLQEICGRLNFKPEMPPPCLVDVKRFLDRLTESIKLIRCRL